MERERKKTTRIMFVVGMGLTFLGSYLLKLPLSPDLDIIFMLVAGIGALLLFEVCITVFSRRAVERIVQEMKKKAEQKGKKWLE